MPSSWATFESRVQIPPVRPFRPFSSRRDAYSLFLPLELADLGRAGTRAEGSGLGNEGGREAKALDALSQRA